MLRECVRLALEEQRVIVFLEPIALYMTRDLHEEGDGLWTAPYAATGDAKPIPLGAIGRHGDGTDLAIVTYGNGYYLSRQAEKILHDEHGLDPRVIDLRWLAPLNEDAILDGIAGCGRVLIVDECRRTGSQSEALMALFAERAPGVACERITAEDSFIPLGRAATLTLPSRDSIVAAALDLVGREAKRG
jgi:2-oxoisovalerate dehydrogenase E1 component